MRARGGVGSEGLLEYTCLLGVMVHGRPAACAGMARDGVGQGIGEGRIGPGGAGRQRRGLWGSGKQSAVPVIRRYRYA